MSLPTASILTIGTEIIDGQIIDSNSQWISRKLGNHQIPIVLHATVSDTFSHISDILTYADQKSDLLFICGGLGPTSDDITRDVLSSHYNTPLELNPEAWQIVQEKLKSRHVQLREGHQRQCLFPKNAVPLENNFGVAPGFYFEVQNKKIWVLPGPPPEIESIWTSSIENQLQRLFKIESQTKLKKWLCLGIAESELAHQTEEFFKTRSFDKKFGYRLQVPYVEVKLWYDSTSSDAKNSIEEFTKTLGSAYIGETAEPVYNSLLTKLSTIPNLHIIDRASTGTLLKKLTDVWGSTPLTWSYHLTSHSLEKDLAEDSSYLIIQVDENNGWLVEFKNSKKSIQWNLDFPQKRKSKYKNQFLIEKLIIRLAQEL